MPAYQARNSEQVTYFSEVLVPSAARTTSSNSGALDGSWGPVKSIRAQLNVTAVTGTNPTLDATIEDSLDGTNWNTIGTFSQKTAAAREVINITTPFADNVRIKWVVGGTATPTFTFDVVAATEVDPV